MVHADSKPLVGVQYQLLQCMIARIGDFARTKRCSGPNVRSLRGVVVSRTFHSFFRHMSLFPNGSSPSNPCMLLCIRRLSFFH